MGIWLSSNNGGYYKANLMSSSEVISLLTPYPVKVQTHKKYLDDKKIFLWNYLQTAFGNRYWITAETIDSEDECKELGIIQSTVYMWTQCFQFSIDKDPKRIILIKNFWSKPVWKGEWSDDSKFWNEEAKTNAKFNNKGSYDFYVTYEEYLEIFKLSTICVYTPEFEKISYQMIKQNKGDYNVVQLDLAKSSEVIIKISQPISMKNSPAKLRFVVNQDIEENKEVDERLYYITGLFEKDEQLSFIESEDAYSKGTYYLFIEFDDVDIDYCLTVISNTDSKITITDFN